MHSLLHKKIIQKTIYIIDKPAEEGVILHQHVYYFNLFQILQTEPGKQIHRLILLYRKVEQPVSG